MSTDASEGGGSTSGLRPSAPEGQTTLAIDNLRSVIHDWEGSQGRPDINAHRSLDVLTARLLAAEARVKAADKALRDCSLILCEKHAVGYSAREGCARCQRDAAQAALAEMREALLHLQANVNHAINWVKAMGDTGTMVHALTEARDDALKVLRSPEARAQGEG